MQTLLQLRTPVEVLDYFKNKFKIPFRVQHFQKQPRYWIEYKCPTYNRYIQKYLFVNHREIFPTELPVDIDAGHNLCLKEGRKETNKLGDIVEKRLKEEKFSYIRWKTGGAGQHFYLEFNELEQYLSKHDKDLIRKFFMNWLMKGIDTTNINAHVCTEPKSLLQLEWAPHRKGGRKTQISSNYSDTNILPDAVKVRLNRFKFKAKQNWKIPVIMINAMNLPCIDIFEKEDFQTLKDGRRRAAFALASYYKNKYPTIKEGYDKLEQWNHTQLKDRHSKKQLMAFIKSARGSVTCRYRMGLLKELKLETVCREKACPHFPRWCHYLDEDD